MISNSLSPDALTRRWRTAIPLLDAMNFQVVDWDGLSLITAAPLAGNHNDKQTGFAGSIAALASVTGWGLTSLITEKACNGQIDKQFQVAIRDSRQFFKHPIVGDLLAHVSVSREAHDQLMAQLQQKGKARLSLVVTVGTEAAPDCARLEGTYVAWSVLSNDEGATS